MNPNKGSQRVFWKSLSFLVLLMVPVLALADQKKTQQQPQASAPALGEDFAVEAKLLSRVVACEGRSPLPSSLKGQAVDKHCEWMRRAMETYRRLYLRRAEPFFAKLLPAGLPDKVVYPFGGGDLVSALSTYPGAREITTVSLELVGDPRRIHNLDSRGLEGSLAAMRHQMVGLLYQNDSASELLKGTQEGSLPGQLCFFLVALAVHGYEPVSLRYFGLETDGSLHYYSAVEIRELEGKAASPLKKGWTSPDFPECFANSELTFRSREPGATLRTHRHIAANLDDFHLQRNRRLMAHLEGKGHVTAMTKAASYCLWNPGFTRIRGYLLAHMNYMVSDSTGIPPEVASKAGFVQESYGGFQGSFLDASQQYNDEFRCLWASQPPRKLAFRYGYLDSVKHYHLVVTRRPRFDAFPRGIAQGKIAGGQKTRQSRAAIQD